MIRVIPFKALVPKSEFANSVVTLGSGKISEEILRAKAESIPHNYIRVVKPQFADPEIQQGSPEFYNASLKNYQYLISEGYLVPQNDAIYFYSQSHHSGIELSGWIVGVAAHHYTDGHVKKHENTLTGKENRLIEHIRVLNSMAEPVLLSQNLPNSLKELSKIVTAQPPIVEVSDEYQNKHRLWQIIDHSMIADVQNIFSSMDSLYIADGHHRVASSSRFLLDANDSEEKGFMALVMDQDDLLIKSFYRLLKNVDASKLIDYLKQHDIAFTFTDAQTLLELTQGNILCMAKDFSIIIHLDKPNAELDAKEKLDVSRIEHLIFEGLFQISDTSKDERISFLRGDYSQENVMTQINQNKVNVAFLFAANTMQEIIDVADAGLIMPPKSTFVEPKLLTGMLIEDYSR